MKKCIIFLCMVLISACNLNPSSTGPIITQVEPAATDGNTTDTSTNDLSPIPGEINTTKSSPAQGLSTEAADMEMAPTVTFTPLPSQPTSTVTPTLQPTLTPTPSSSVARYVLQSGVPQPVSNFTHPELGCNWMGIGGQVFGADGSPVVGLVVEVVGVLDGKQVTKLALTGSSSAFGPGGYEISLENKVIASQSALYVQLFDLDGKPISGQIFFDTYADCNKNLIVVNFINRSSALPLKNYVPGIHKSR